MPPEKKKFKTGPWQEQLKSLHDKDPVLTVSANGAPLLDIHSESLFADMIHPLPVPVFMESCFRRKAVHVSTGNSRVESIVEAMNHLDPASILRETSSENVFVWLLNHQKKIQSIEVDNVDTAIALHTTGGHATYCRASPQVEQPMVYNMLRGTGMGFGNYDPSGERTTIMGRGEVEVFMGTFQHITDWHYDFQENFTLQLTGTKKWTLQQGCVKYPLRGCTPHYMAPDVVESQLKAAHLANGKFQFGTPQAGVNANGRVTEVVLKPGDMLYFPAGMWHKVETIEPGVSINCSLMATNYATLACQALHHYLLTKDEWRETVVSGPTSTSSTALEHMKALLDELPKEIEYMTNTLSFAEAILPPVLRYPPAFGVVADDGNGEVEIDEENMAQEDDEGDEEKVADDDDQVNASTFEIPDNWSPDFSQSGTLVVNKLASLLKMSDINTFYSKTENESSNLYVLNINFGGNEAHESTVRVVFCDRDGNLNDYVDGQPTERIACPDGVREPWRQCLVYYGFFLWQPDAVQTS